MRSVGSGRSLVISVRSTVSSMRSSHSRTPAIGVRVRRMFCATVRSGSSAGSWKTGAKPTLRAPSGEPIADVLAVDLDRAGVVADDAGEDLHERALAGAVGAQQRVHLARLDDQVGGLERDDRAVALRDVADFEQTAWQA